MKQVLYLLMGLPGSGKTTAAKALEQITGATRLTSDEVRLKLWVNPDYSEVEHEKLYEHLNTETLRLLKAGNSVIYDANLNRKIHRQEKYELAKSLNVTCKLLWVQTATDLARDRRIEDTNHHHLVPTDETPIEMFERVAAVFEEPDNEDFVELDGTKISEQYIKDKLTLDETPR